LSFAQRRPIAVYCACYHRRVAAERASGRGQRKRAVSFRFKPETVERLRRRSAQKGVGQGELAERYLEEGMRMEEHPGIYFRDAGSGRRASLVGTGLDIAQVVETLRQNASSVERTAEYLDLPAAMVETALRYYVAHRDEVDEWIEEARTAAEEERRLWRQREHVLAG
jgi:uncharacterized protein (DUF433 family)